MAADDGIDIGDVVRMARLFTDEAGAPADPDAVVLLVKPPDASSFEIEAQHPTEDEEAAVAALLGIDVGDGTGVFTATMEPDAHGLWRYWWQGSQGVTSAEPGNFYVRRRRVPEPEGS